MSAPRPKRRCVLEAEASRRTRVDEDSGSDESESDESESDESESDRYGESDESYESESGSAESAESAESEIDDMDVTEEGADGLAPDSAEKDGAGKVKRESLKRLAALLGIGVLEMQRGAFVLEMLSHPSDSSDSGEVLSISQFLDMVYARGNVDSATRAALDQCTDVATSARAWASPVVDALASVFGGDAVRVFQDLGSWTVGMQVYIALRVSRTVSLRSIELDIASIRAEAGHEPMQIAGAILRELAAEYAFVRGSLRSLERAKQGPPAIPVDMTLPKGFPGKCGPGNHAITYQPKLLLEIERWNDDKRLASIVSNAELYGSGSISMFTAAQEIRRLLSLGPHTKRAWRAIPENATVLLSASVLYFPHSSDGKDVKTSPGSRVEFGKTKHRQRLPRCARNILHVRFAKRHVIGALERPDIVRVLFSPHYNRSCKGLNLALVKIKLRVVYPSVASSVRVKGRVASLDYIRKVIECHKNRKRSRPRFLEGPVLLR
jgi:hypothetical protein